MVVLILKWILAIACCVPVAFIIFSKGGDLINRWCDAVEEAEFSIVGKILIQPIASLFDAFVLPAIVVWLGTGIPILILDLFGLI